MRERSHSTRFPSWVTTHLIDWRLLGQWLTYSLLWPAYSVSVGVSGRLWGFCNFCRVLVMERVIRRITSTLTIVCTLLVWLQVFGDCKPWPEFTLACVWSRRRSWRRWCDRQVGTWLIFAFVSLLIIIGTNFSISRLFLLCFNKHLTVWFTSVVHFFFNSHNVCIMNWRSVRSNFSFGLLVFVNVFFIVWRDFFFSFCFRESSAAVCLRKKLRQKRSKWIRFFSVASLPHRWPFFLKKNTSYLPTCARKLIVIELDWYYNTRSTSGTAVRSTIKIAVSLRNVCRVVNLL